jgi:transposase
VEEFEPIKTEHLGHLGLVSATIKELKLIEKINQRLELNKSKGGKISHGHRAASMILNGLGYINRTLYLSSHFFEDKPLDLLLGIDITPSELNDDMLGRHLDEIAKYGTTKLYSEIAFEICLEQGLLGKSYHLDTTTFTLHGDYEDYPNASPLPCLGHSKDHRPDLKQVTLSLTQVGAANIPIWMEALDGNASDKKTFQETAKMIEQFHEQLKATPDNLLFVVDAMFYTPEKLAELSKVKWITRVPATYKESKNLLLTPPKDLTWKALNKGYEISVTRSEVGGISQRWVLVHSQQAKKRELKTFYKRLDREFEKQHKALWHLSNQTFSCQTDATKALKAIEKKLCHYSLRYDLVPVMKYSSKGRPKKDEAPECIGYQCHAYLASDLSKIKHAIDCLGRFILATNELDENLISDEGVLSEYKAQTHIEAGFRFMKLDSFELNHIFLKNPSRIGALMMIMTLCLMVYNFAQYSFRQALEDKNTVIPNQLGKPIKNPTMRWVFQLMSSITVLCLWNNTQQIWVKKICNVKKLHKTIVFHFGKNAKKIYGIPINEPLPVYDKNQKSLLEWCGT